jgi:hypothetical protein
MPWRMRARRECEEELNVDQIILTVSLSFNGKASND